MSCCTASSAGRPTQSQSCCALSTVHILRGNPSAILLPLSVLTLPLPCVCEREQESECTTYV